MNTWTGAPSSLRFERGSSVIFTKPYCAGNRRGSKASKVPNKRDTSGVEKGYETRALQMVQNAGWYNTRHRGRAAGLQLTFFINQSGDS